MNESNTHYWELGKRQKRINKHQKLKKRSTLFNTYQMVSYGNIGTPSRTVQCDSLPPGRGGSNKKNIFKLILQDSSLGTCCKIHSLTYGKSTLVQAMAWCYQATRQYLSQCWPRSMTPYSATRPQWVKILYMFYKAEFHSMRRSRSCRSKKFWNFIQPCILIQGFRISYLA